MIEWAAERQVFLASPITLIAVLKAIAVGWREERIARNAQAIGNLGRELYSRIAVFVDHLGTLRRGLDTAVTAYNRAVGSFESRVLVSARRFRDFGAVVSDDELEIQPIEQSSRGLTAPEVGQLVSLEEPRDDSGGADAPPLV